MIAITSNVQAERLLPIAPSGSVAPSSYSATSASAAGTGHSPASSEDSVSLSERAEAQLLHQQGQGPSDIASRLDVDVSHVKDDLRITVDGVSLVPSPTRLAATGASPAVTPLIATQLTAPPSSDSSATGNKPVDHTAASPSENTNSRPGSAAPTGSTQPNSTSGHIDQIPSPQDETSPSSPNEPETTATANSTVAALTAGLTPPRIEGLVVPVLPPRG